MTKKVDRQWLAAGEKPITKRSATARALMYLGAGVIQKRLEGDN
ncbi:MAG: hypothetical protein R2784_08795 [Saprospiraceae bacterium]